MFVFFLSFIAIKCQQRLVSEKYFGTLIGHLQEGQPASGQVYAADETTIFIRGFKFAGNNYPFSFFQAGFTPYPDESGFIIPDERGS